MSPTTRPAPRRERARAATIGEIKQTALGLMREGGPAAVRFADIARVMDMTPPALYRYFADRDELISALITDAYEALGSAVAHARAQVPDGDIAGGFVAAAQAYRQWAHSEPQQFALILGLPLPDYAAPADGSTSEAAGRAMAQLSSLFVEALHAGRLDPPRIRDVHPAVEQCARTKEAHTKVSVGPQHFQAMLHAWASLHGFTSLEANGHFDWMTPEARDALFLGQLRLAAEAAGLPTPPAP
ncbi:TetR/AcrR family transcriptional regulator [Phytohabitans aurantiacus]|jgi:AcrR family transcriptional regulator|uniref:TetR family transcriptional regulator n=1 Tax=Phytohabitans aurantiacus TaxID=3016789 RepID=A0ABQ5R902_9ACTN|nr:TetR/AcrR family transcriptional regulator [Phytohabitans aurantiacus]GLI03244.1 TetR family transcriptional regulator [Phytohabitans aurantiacus]